ncbi:MAG TPA: helix-turn-helix transcriptional regulator [Pseudonocardiaceae bacterium]|jgi:hypothetical protein|nr:helix-turn-helix transcriptional regulator [Pseudonocardiaceae bacterium]
MAATQTRRKRRLGRYMRELRDRSGRKPEDAKESMGISKWSIWRWEKGDSLPRLAELQVLTSWYGATDAEKQEALTRWHDAKQDTTRVIIPGSASSQLRSYLRGEADAETEKIICVLVVDGLLQTGDYARAILRAPSGLRMSDTEIEELAAARASRQALLQGDRPLKVRAVLDEAVVRRVVGGPQVMRDQLTHLLNLAEQPNITLQVVPYEAGAFGTMSGSTAVLEFHDAEDPPVAYVEYVRGGAWVENRDDVNMLATTFDLASEVALTPADTADLIRRQIEGLTK